MNLSKLVSRFEACDAEYSKKNKLWFNRILLLKKISTIWKILE